MSKTSLKQQMLNYSTLFNPDVMLVDVADISEQGISQFFKQLLIAPKQTIIIDNNLQRLQRMLVTNREQIKVCIRHTANKTAVKI